MLPTTEDEPRLEIPAKIKREFHWFSVIYFLHLNIVAGFALVWAVPQAHTSTLLFCVLMIILGHLGVTAGAHRLWAHRSYKASTSLRFFLMMCQTSIGQGSLYNWILRHRIHHKYVDTNFDPFNPKRGFLYSHFMQFLEADHEHQDKLEEDIDMSDIKEDGLVMFQQKFYWAFYLIFFLLLPINTPAEYFGEQIMVSCMIMWPLRQFFSLNLSWLVHSASNIWCLDKQQRYPSDSNLIFFVNQTYWVQYHYIVPWDYLTGEFGKYGTDLTTLFIRVCAVLGWATDLKTIDSDSVKEATYKAVQSKLPISCCLKEVEKVCIEKEFFLKPVNVMM